MASQADLRASILSSFCSGQRLYRVQSSDSIGGIVIGVCLSMSVALRTAIAEYLSDLAANRATGATVAETTHYPALQKLLDAIGAELKPAVRCITGLSDQGAGMPDGGLFVASQFQQDGQLQDPTNPERGVIEAKGVAADVRKVARTEQVRRYWASYRQVLVTSFREFLLVGEIDGRQTVLESFSFAPTADEFWQLAAKPRSLPAEVADQFVEFLQRVMLSRAKIATPEQVAWFLASYARDARSRIDRCPDLPALQEIRQSFEQGLGIHFDSDRGDRFFRSTLVQTLFYGIFSAWTIWHRQRGDRPGEFFWETSWRYLRVPVLQSLFHRLGDPEILESLNLIELFDWTANVLNRVVRPEFFQRFEDEKAVQYFYEPFLQAFDPELRKDFGVWYTPPEVVRYMVERVDRVLRAELDCEDGLASPDVYVLDPCCGTGAYLVAVIEKIAATLATKSQDGAMGALGGLTEAGQSLKDIILSRVFGFELLTAPFAIAHLQVALELDELGDPLSTDGQSRDRAGIFLTNALTGWTVSVDEEQQKLAFMNVFERERDAADQIKQKQPILVVLGNPPYNSFAGMAVDEERELSETYRSVERVAKPQGQGLNDLYVRFFRMAERRIVEQTQKGIVCFISNYSWLDGLSFTGMRERYLNAFDRIYVDNLHGDKYATGKVTPDGKPDPSIFSTDWNKEGIQVGTAIALLVKREAASRKQARVDYREFWGKSKWADLLVEVKPSKKHAYQRTKPSLDLGLPFKPKSVDSDYFGWPLLTDLFPTSFPGVKTSRDDMLTDFSRDGLEEKFSRYQNPNLSAEELGSEYPDLVQKKASFDPLEIRNLFLNSPENKGQIIKFCYRPFDLRYLFWESETGLLDRSRPDFKETIFEGNFFLEARQKESGNQFTRGYVSRHLADNLGNGLSSFFPLKVISSQVNGSLLDEGNIFNQSEKVLRYLSEVFPEGNEDFFFHVISIIHAASYRCENTDALCQDWPRIPLPRDRAQLQTSAALGQRLAALLDPETPIDGITVGTIAEPYNQIALPSTTHGENFKAEDFTLTANWGYGGNGKPVMPGKGQAIRRDYTDAERQQMGEAAISLLGAHTYDIYLNDHAYWGNIPERVWQYTIGGYQVIKKWLSYRAEKVLGRAMKPDEVRDVTHIARRISAILLMEPELDANYAAVKVNPYPWPK